MKLNLENIINTLKDMRDYIIPIKRISQKFKKINSIEELKSFIKERSAHVTQTTLYGYLKTRIGSRYAMMFEDKVFIKSVNIAKWNIYVSALSDCTIYTFSYLIDKKNLKENKAKEIYDSILNGEKENGLDVGVCEDSKKDFRILIGIIFTKNNHLNKVGYLYINGHRYQMN